MNPVWILVLFFANDAQATWREPFPSREACEIARSQVLKSADIIYQLHPGKYPQIAYATCVPAQQEARHVGKGT